MHKLLAALLVSTFMFCYSFAFADMIDLSTYTIEELLNLRDEIDDVLEEKGHVVYFDIERADKGKAIVAVQERLSELGYYTGKLTGKYDSETQKAFKEFEKANGLENDSLASREDQIVLFGNDVTAKATAEPKVEITSEPQNNADREIEHDVSFDYEHCMRYPDEHIGEKYILKGKVEQTLGNRTDGFQIRFSVLGNGDEIIYVYINEDPGYNILKSDWLIINLMMYGTVTYESVWGQEITIPAALASEVVLR